jgi:integrase
VFSVIKNLTWSQIDFEKRILTVGEAKTDAGTGRTIPLNGSVISALADHARWYQQRFGTAQPDWFVFPGGGRSPKDPTTSITCLKTAWTTIRKAAGVVGRWHDNRHTLITELLESGAGDQTVMEIAGHVSPQMLKRYGHIRTAAKRTALDDVDRTRAANKERRAAQQAAPAPADALVQ